MRKLLVLGAVVAGLPLAAHAQHSHAMSDGGAMSHGSVALPEACTAAAEVTDSSGMMGGMEGMTSGLDAVQEANRNAMMTMHEPMMTAATIKDPDLAFNCGMIAHHQGAIAMSEVELKMGKDEPSKALARMMIEAQKKEIADMTARVEALVR